MRIVGISEHKLLEFFSSFKREGDILLKIKSCIDAVGISLGLVLAVKLKGQVALVPI